MKRFKYKWQAELYLKWINFYIPLTIKKKSWTLISNSSKVFYSKCLYPKKPWAVYKAFITKELIDDLNNLPSLNRNIEKELVKN